MNETKRRDIVKTEIPSMSLNDRVHEYFVSKAEGRIVKKDPEWDIARDSPSLKLISSQRKLYEIEQNLQQKREKHQNKRKELDENWEELRKKEQQLRDNFIYFNKFVKENQEKREWAENKSTEEVTVQNDLDNEIEKITVKLNEIIEIRDQMQNSVNKYKIYENFLQSVVEKSPEFKSIHDILNRYEALTAAKQELANKQENDLELLEEARIEMIRLTDEKAQAVMGLNNKLAELQTRYDKAMHQALHWEMAVSKIKSAASKRILEQGQVYTCIWNLYLLICKRKNIQPVIEKQNVEAQLTYIKNVIIDLKKVCRTAKRKAARDLVSVSSSFSKRQSEDTAKINYSKV